MHMFPRSPALVGLSLASLVSIGCSDDSQTTGTGGASTTTSVSGSTTSSTGDTTSSTTGGFQAPQVVTAGGPVLVTPKAVAITYDADPLQSSIDAFVAAVGSSSYWSQTTSEYGVGPLTGRPPIHLSDAPPATITDAAVAQLLKSNIGGANPPWGAPDPNTNYVFVFPVGTAVNLQGDLCCGPSYDAYHGEVFAGGTSVSYSVVCECPGYDGPNVTLLQSTTAAISHELVESATDPFVDTAPAYGQTDDPHAAWTVATGGETADMCQYLVDWGATPADLGFTVQRSWSNAAAAAGQDPCVPAPANGAYFVSVPSLTDAVTLDYYGSPWSTQGVQIPVGSSKAVEVDLFSTDPATAAWTVEAFDVGATGTDLSFSWDKTSGKSGDKLVLTITVHAADPSLKGEPFSILSTLNGRSSIWYGVVGN